MPNTDRFRRWAEMVSSSDAVLVQLAGLALVAVYAWERSRTLPEPWRGWARTLYVALALGFLLVQLVTTRGALYLMLLAVGGSLTLRAVWVYRRRHPAAALTTKGLDQ